jgi:hypothetical protein
MVEVNDHRVPLKAPARAGGSQGANADNGEVLINHTFQQLDQLRFWPEALTPERELTRESCSKLLGCLNMLRRDVEDTEWQFA